MTALDWSAEGRGDIGHAVIDIAPDHGEPECYTGWYARQLGIDPVHDSYHATHWLGPLLAKMATAGVLVKTGGQYQCGGTDSFGRRCDRWHQEACYYRLALDRTEARERWDEHTHNPRWWDSTRRAESTGPSFAALVGDVGDGPGEQIEKLIGRNNELLTQLDAARRLANRPLDDLDLDALRGRLSALVAPLETVDVLSAADRDRIRHAIEVITDTVRVLYHAGDRP